jgi:hypothetical protein
MNQLRKWDSVWMQIIKSLTFLSEVLTRIHAHNSKHGAGCCVPSTLYLFRTPFTWSACRNCVTIDFQCFLALRNDVKNSGLRRGFAQSLGITAEVIAQEPSSGIDKCSCTWLISQPWPDFDTLRATACPGAGNVGRALACVSFIPTGTCSGKWWLHMYLPGTAAPDCYSLILISCLGCSQKAAQCTKIRGRSVCMHKVIYTFRTT